MLSLFCQPVLPVLEEAYVPVMFAGTWQTSSLTVMLQDDAGGFDPAIGASATVATSREGAVGGTRGTGTASNVTVPCGIPFGIILGVCDSGGRVARRRSRVWIHDDCDRQDRRHP